VQLAYFTGGVSAALPESTRVQCGPQRVANLYRRRRVAAPVRIYVKRLVVIGFLLTGCMPYAIPPATGSVGVTHASERGTRAGVHADLGLSPLQLSPSQIHRRWDVVVSGSFDRVSDNTWGAAIAAGPLLHPWGKLDDARTARVAPQLVGRWTTKGTAAALRIGVERAGFVTGSDASSTSGGWGEIAAGLYVEAAYMRPDGKDDGWSVTAGVTLRLPAMIGVACCFSYR